MEPTEITEKDRKQAEACASCPVCRRARRKQRGLAFWFVKTVESGICPNCRAYEKVYGRKAHEPIPVSSDDAEADPADEPQDD